MDPRHPELAIARMRELMKQFDEVLYRMEHGRTSGNLAEYEREGSLVVQEICLVAPRLHEAMMQTSRQRRHDLAHGVIEHFVREATPEEAKALDEAVKELEKKEKAEPKPRKKKAAKKKAKK